MMTKTQKLEKTMEVMNAVMPNVGKVVRMVNNKDIRDQLSEEELATVNQAYEILKDLQHKLNWDVPFMD